MNGKAIRNTLALVLVAMGVVAGVGPVQAMGDRTPTAEERPGWVRPGDVLADQRAGQGESPPEAPAQALPQPEGGAPQVFFGPEGAPADWRWKARLVVVFADTAQDPAYLRQMRALEAGVPALVEREVVVVVDTDPAAHGAWRRVLRPEGFSLILIDMDGTVMLRKPAPWDMREISRAIDRFPQRRQELRRDGLMP